MFLVCFFSTFQIFVFNFCCEAKLQTKTKIEAKDDTYLEETEARFVEGF